MALAIILKKIPMYPIFYLLKEDYRSKCRFRNIYICVYICICIYGGKTLSMQAQLVDNQGAAALSLDSPK